MGHHEYMQFWAIEAKVNFNFTIRFKTSCLIFCSWTNRAGQLITNVLRCIVFLLTILDVWFQNNVVCCYFFLHTFYISFFPHIIQFDSAKYLLTLGILWYIHGHNGFQHETMYYSIIRSEHIGQNHTSYSH